MNFHFFGKKISVAAKYHDKNALEVDCRLAKDRRSGLSGPASTVRAGPQNEMNTNPIIHYNGPDTPKFAGKQCAEERSDQLR
ncbi:hypothetical protein [Candidatus Methylomicrobium oryzae]|uniref:hypothetical protein n=1 Tax=Candidatus Methylomicrobium oryzae TaxID=2802053 RepID=UPI0019231917|nr:hypothetical protein [Methylomicrobium sp. RS1]MBL1265312.1 hypothetical protein [Methylomicrobium sp. RS1]